MYKDTSINAATLREAKFKMKMKKLKELKREEMERQQRINIANEYIKNQEKRNSSIVLPNYLSNHHSTDFNEVLRLSKL